jgi:hypothetical protein
MNTILKQLVKDIENYNLPKDLSSYDKIHCELKHDNRIYWYYKEEMDFWQEEGLNIYECYKDMNSGIIVGRPDIDVRGSELDVEDCVVIIDNYPTEKEYPVYTWISLKRILDDKFLVDIFDDKMIGGWK